MDFPKFPASLSCPPFLFLWKGAELLSSPCSALAWSPEGHGSGPLSRSLFTPDMKSGEQCAVHSLPGARGPPPRRAHTRTHALTHSRETHGQEGLEVLHDMHLRRWTAPEHRAEVETVEPGSVRA